MFCGLYFIDTEDSSSYTPSSKKEVLIKAMSRTEKNRKEKIPHHDCTQPSTYYADRFY